MYPFCTEDTRIPGGITAAVEAASWADVVVLALGEGVNLANLMRAGKWGRMMTPEFKRAKKLMVMVEILLLVVMMRIGYAHATPDMMSATWLRVMPQFYIGIFPRVKLQFRISIADIQHTQEAHSFVHSLIDLRRRPLSIYVYVYVFVYVYVYGYSYVCAYVYVYLCVYVYVYVER